MGAHLIHGGVLYPPRLDCHGNETRMPLKCIRHRQNQNSDAYKTKFGCQKTKLECLRKRKKTYSNARTRNSDAFGNEKNHIQIRENQYSNAYLSFWFIYFGPTVVDVGDPHCGISVHTVSISAGPTWHPAVSSNNMDGSIYYPDCMLPILTGAMACSLVYIHTT